MNPISDEILDLGYDYGTVTTLKSRTEITRTSAGYEQRNAVWEQPLLTFEIGDRTLNKTNLETLQTFFEARQGSFEAFYFKDWSDHLVNSSGANSKTYAIGGVSVVRPIYKVSPNPNPDGSYDFYVPVRFEQDKIDYQFEAIEPTTGEKIFRLARLTLQEVRLDSDLAPSPLPISSSDLFWPHQIELAYDYDSIGGPLRYTRILFQLSGFENRESIWENPRGDWEIGGRDVTREELDYFIALFRVTRGSCVAFQYFDWGSEMLWPVRIKDDQMSVRFEAAEPGTDRGIWTLVSLGLVGVDFGSPVIGDPDPTIIPVESSLFVIDISSSTFVNASIAGFFDETRQNNLTATTNPTINDNSVQGYEFGSIWENTVTGQSFWLQAEPSNEAEWLRVSVDNQTGVVTYSDPFTVLDLEKFALLNFNQALIDSNKPDLKVGLIVFNSSAFKYPFPPDSSLLTAPDSGELNAAVSTLISFGGTNISAALQAALEVLDDFESAAPGRAVNVTVFTDAFTSEVVGDLTSLANEIIDRGHRVRGFAIGQNADIEAMQLIDPEAKKFVSSQEAYDYFKEKIQ